MGILLGFCLWVNTNIISENTPQQYVSHITTLHIGVFDDVIINVSLLLGVLGCIVLAQIECPSEFLKVSLTFLYFTYKKSLE
jgi:hypothetical protein